MKLVRIFSLCSLFAALILPNAHAQQSNSKPNIIIILADDMGSGDASSYNPASKIQTPNIDRLVSQGLHFTDAHSSSAVCTPSRYSILTGQYAWRSSLKKGVLNSDSDPLIPATRMTLASMLKNKGYYSAAIGKWHLGLKWKDKKDWSKGFTQGPTDLGFDYFYGIPASLDMPDYAYLEGDSTVKSPTIPIAENPMPAMWRAGLVASNFKHVEVLSNITNRAVDYISERTTVAPNKPFFLYLALTAPHLPHIVPDRIEGVQIKGASQAGERGDLMYMTDWSVGKILRALDDLDIADNTIVFFASDNGAQDFTYHKTGHTPHLNYRGQKADIFEGGHRIPLIVRWPGVVVPNTVSNETVSLVDFMATLAAITGYSLPNNAGEDSYSLLPVLLGKTLTKPLREATVLHSGDGFFAIRKGPWKLTPDNMGSGGFTAPESVAGKGTLYNLDWDISEITNRYDNRPGDVQILRTLLQKYQTDGRSTPLPRNDAFWIPASTSSSSTASSKSASSRKSSSSSKASSLSNSSSASGTCSAISQYVNGAIYNTNDVVKNIGNRYRCDVAGWCSTGGPYEPGVGWAWTNAWTKLGACQ